ncbi:MAG: Thymidylate kinase [Chlamydiales bacterium]|nr:Thymidylate kinase [Chlamydiales bacterium]
MQQSNKPYEGLFITLEGGEGSGKTTLAESIAASLEKRGYTVTLTREPGGSALSECLRDVLLNPKKAYSIGERAELLLFLAARAQHIEEQILPALRAGKVVICDRFNDSSIAYQGCARHLGKQYVEKLCLLATEGLSEPSCTLFLDLDPAIGMERVQHSRHDTFDRMEQERLQFHREVRQGYLHLADEYPERIEVIDAAQPFDAVLVACLQALEPHLLLKPV